MLFQVFAHSIAFSGHQSGEMMVQVRVLPLTKPPPQTLPECVTPREYVHPPRGWFALPTPPAVPRDPAPQRRPKKFPGVAGASGASSKTQPL